MTPWEYPLFALFGLLVGTYGTLVGLGGGFIIVPVLLLVYQASPQYTVGTSLAVVFFNAVSGTMSYMRQKRVDFRSGVKFALATVPGALIGSYLSIYLTSRLFSLAFGAIMIASSAMLVWKPEARRSPNSTAQASPSNGRVTRRLVDARGNVFAYSFNERAGVVLSFFVGFLSSILGIGGGVVHVPALIHVFSFPAHVATATSQFILVISTGVGASSHMALGNVMIGPAISMGMGVVAGAQVGAALSRRLRGAWIVRLLALALLIAGARLISEGMSQTH